MSLRLDQEGDAVAWDAVLATAGDRSVYQSAGWGEYRRTAGWVPLRVIAREGMRPIGAAQLLVRRIAPGLVVAWGPGAPMFEFPGADTLQAARWLPLLVRHVREQAGYVRLDCLHQEDPSLAAALDAAFARPIVPVNTGRTTVLDLRDGASVALERMRKEHRRELRIALAANIRWATAREGMVIEDLVRIHREMLALKTLRARRSPDAGDVANVLRCLPEARVTVGYLGSTPVTGALIVGFAKRAVLQTPATAAAGRAVSASYGLVARVASELAADGVEELDLGGLSRRQRPTGVDLFKLGFRGELRRRLGEWDAGRTALVRIAASIAVAIRGPELR